MFFFFNLEKFSRSLRSLAHISCKSLIEAKHIISNNLSLMGFKTQGGFKKKKKIARFARSSIFLLLILFI